LYTEYDLVEREPVLLRFRLKEEHIKAMVVDPQHPKDKTVRLIKEIAIDSSEIEALTSQGWVPLADIDDEVLSEIMPKVQ
jgi:Asp-tRNA(Asn)/Glu-tRNA(Gln) amidotransferase B subunit